MLRRGGLRLVAATLWLLGCGPRAAVSSDPEPLPIAVRTELRAAARGGDAEAVWRDAVARFPGSWEAERGLQDALRARLAPAVVEAVYRARRAERPDALSDYLLARAIIYRRDEAEALFRSAADKAPEAPWPIAGLAQLERARGDLFLTVRTLEEGVERLPRSATLRLLLGNQLLDLRLLPSAERHLESADRLRPGDPDTIAARGRVWAGLGEPERAEALLREALSMDPLVADAHRSLARVLLERRDGDGADEHYRRSLELGSERDDDLQAAIRAARFVGNLAGGG